ncbi:MAG: Flp pilus assembly protein CpaB [Actinobacteria bacterium]|nr:Flp pilus assembly protein CpaB [Actinomycetota bacterium]
MFRRSPRTVLLWLAAAVVALATAAHVAGLISSLERQDRAFGRVHAVVIAARDLAVGVRLDRGDLRVRRVRGDAAGPGALGRPHALVGAVVRVPLLRGAVVTDRHLADAERGPTSAVVPSGLRAMRILLDRGTRPRPGDVVDVYATFDPQVVGEDAEPTLTVAPAAAVVAVDDEGVTVLVTPEQAKRLAFSVAAGTVALAIAPPEEASEAYG